MFFRYAKTKLCHKYNIDKSETGRVSEREAKEGEREREERLHNEQTIAVPLITIVS